MKINLCMEPFDLGNATRYEGGRIVYGKGGSSSSSSNATNSTNIDRRQVVDSGGVGVSSDSSTVTITNSTLDGGVIKGALDYVKATDATQGSNFTALLGLADKMFATGAGVIKTAQDTTLAQIGQINTAQNDAKDQISQKTIMIIAAAGLGYFALTKKG